MRGDGRDGHDALLESISRRSSGSTQTCWRAARKSHPQSWKARRTAPRPQTDPSTTIGTPSFHRGWVCDAAATRATTMVALMSSAQIRTATDAGELVALDPADRAGERP